MTLGQLLAGLAECEIRMSELKNLKLVGDDGREFIAALVQLDREELSLSDLKADPEDIDQFDAVFQDGAIQKKTREGKERCAAPLFRNDPSSRRCELTAGHRGAHIEGTTGWFNPEG